MDWMYLALANMSLKKARRSVTKKLNQISVLISPAKF